MFSSLSSTGVSIVECFSSKCFCSGVGVVASRGVAHIDVADFHDEISIISSTRTIRIVGARKQLVQLVGNNGRDFRMITMIGSSGSGVVMIPAAIHEDVAVAVLDVILVIIIIIISNNISSSCCSFVATFYLLCCLFLLQSSPGGGIIIINGANVVVAIIVIVVVTINISISWSPQQLDIDIAFPRTAPFYSMLARSTTTASSFRFPSAPTTTNTGKSTECTIPVKVAAAAAAATDAIVIVVMNVAAVAKKARKSRDSTASTQNALPLDSSSSSVSVCVRTGVGIRILYHADSADNG